MATLSRGERFTDARKVHNQHGNQTMKEVETATGVSASLIQALEDDNNARSVGYDKVALLAKHYGVTTDWLLCLTEDPAIKPSAVDELGLSEKAVKIIISYANARGFEDCLPGLNLLIEQGDILCIAAFVYRFRNFVRKAGEIERSYSKDTTYLKDATKLRNVTNYTIADGLEQMICEEYPYLKGHIRILAGANAVRRGKDDIVSLFEEKISKITGYNSYMDEIEYRNTH